LPRDDIGYIQSPERRVSAANNPGMTVVIGEACGKFVTPGSPRSLPQTIAAFPSAYQRKESQGELEQTYC